jgi:hypothetical protein
MTRALSVALLLLGIMASACTDNPVGRICFIGADAGTETENVIASPALECESRTCLHIQGFGPDLCTAECSDNSDCDAVKNSPCDTGFVCMVPVVVGPFCCKKLCVCRDYVVVPDGGVQTPAACDPSIPANECRNIR